MRRPPRSPWTWSAKLCLVVAAWCTLGGVADCLGGRMLWAVGELLLALFNVAVAAWSVRVVVRWQEAWARLERRGVSR